MTAAPTPTGARIAPALIVPFVNAARSVFGTMIRVPTTVRRPFLKNDRTAGHEVSSIIGFSGEVLGSVVLALNAEVARRVTGAFAGSPVELDDPDFPDAVGELSNMIAGGAKKDLGTEVYMTVPTVIIGRGHCVARLRDVPCVCIPCLTPLGEFVVEVNIKYRVPPG